jgi:hypothetical protein
MVKSNGCCKEIYTKGLVLMNQQELQELQQYIEELKREADVGYLEAEDEIDRFNCLGFRTACKLILDKIKRLERRNKHDSI